MEIHVNYVLLKEQYVPLTGAMTLYLLNKVVLQLSNKLIFSQRCAEIACKIKIILFFFKLYESAC